MVVGDGVSVGVRERGGGGSGASREHCANPRSVGECRWGVWRRGEPHTKCPGSHLCLYSAGHRGPPTIKRLSAPDQGAVKGHVKPLGSNVWR